MSSALISAQQLHEQLGDQHVVILDVRGTWSTGANHDEYAAGHIPGAIFVDWTKEFLEQGVARNLASVAQRQGAERSFARLGIERGDTVVIYDDYHHMLAGRIWWALRYWGFENVRVLNGGWRHWVSRSLPVSTDVPEVSEGSFQPQRQDGLRVGLEAFIAERASACVIDARGPIGYGGKPDDPRSGHIPGALNLPFKAVLDEDTGLFLSNDALAQVFDQTVAEWRRARLISSCGAGYAGTVVMLALLQWGVQSSLFDGSFSAWKQDPARAVEQA